MKRKLKKCRVLVIGGAGYIWTHMVKRLLEEGSEVIVLDNLSTGHKELARERIRF